MWTREIAFSIVPLAIFNSFFAITLTIFVIGRALKKIDVTDQLDSRHRGTVVLGTTLREYWYWLTGPVERALIAVRMTPNMITTMGLVLACVAAVLYYLGHVGSAGYALIFSSTCDMFDGRVARATGRQTRSGAFYDSVLDRVGESIVYIGIAGYLQFTPLLYVALAALVGSLMVSYVKARAEGMNAKCDIGLMQRPERLFLLCILSLFDPLVKAWAAQLGFPDVHYLMIGAVGVIALLTWYTTYQRLAYSFNDLAASEQQGAVETEATAESK